MTPAVSYANVAMGQNSDPIDQVGTNARTLQTVETAAAPTEKAVGTSVKNSVDPSDGNKEKKPLAPAPVPTKSAWGVAVNCGTSSSVDEHKWPTPDKATSNELLTVANQRQKKFIKPITNKWVPINVKVILPSGRNNNQKQNRNRKNKKSNNPQKKQGSSGSNLNGQGEIQPVSPEAIVKSDNEDNTSQHVEDSQKKALNRNTTTSQQKPVKRYSNHDNANGTYDSSQTWYVNQTQSFSPEQTQQQNGFLHPQPNVHNQNHQNFNRQFRPNQYRQQNNKAYQQSFAPVGNYMNGSMPFPQQFTAPIPPQIPPPISPKQDPRQALFQQIDYYFSLENLIKDTYLRSNMDAEGWIPLSLILNFKRVKIIINGIQNSFDNEEADTEAIIRNSLMNCDNAEVDILNGTALEEASVEEIRLRVKNDYKHWLLPRDS